MVTPTLSLRIDIDTFFGCRDAVPSLLRVLDACGVCASFFVVTGSDTSGRHMRRVTTPGYLRRLRAVNAIEVLRRLRLRSMLYGTVLSGPRVAQGNRALLRTVAAAGHELGAHGDDHARWADHVDTFTELEVVDTWTRAFSDFADVLGYAPSSAAAPNWRVSPRALVALDRVFVRYRSDVRGAGVFVPRVGELRCVTPQFAVNLPACHELLALHGGTLDEAAARVLASLDAAVPNVWCLHDWFEGLRAPGIVRAVVEGARARGYAIRTMAEVFDEVWERTAGVLSEATVLRAAVPGGVGTVSVRQ